MKIHENISLKAYNTFGIDVKASAFVEVYSIEELQDIIKSDEFNKRDFLILGGGSNILFTRDYDGLLVRNCIEGISVEDINKNEVLVTAGAGVVWDELVSFCVERGYGGIENLVLIPGRVGAAPIQNIGAYGVELKDSFHSLQAVDVSNGEISSFYASDCKFGYRDSIFKGENRGSHIIVSLCLMLNKDHSPDVSYGAIKGELQTMELGENVGIRDVAKAITSIRRSKLPDPEDIGNAGSFFKNPVIEEEKFREIRNRYPDIPSYKEREGFVKVPAGWLIESCGWKGKELGNAAVHENQALVLVNKGNATGKEILRLARRIKASVFDEFGITLEYEVNII